MISAFLFDFDGVVVDSEPIHTFTKGLALDFFGIEYPPDIFDRFKGTSEEKFFVHVSAELDPHHRPAGQFIAKRQQLLASFLPQMPVLDGFFDFMDGLRTWKIKTALVTSSTTQELGNMDTHLNLLHLFDEVISADSTLRHKPNPDPYLVALNILQVKPQEAIVLEDSQNGILSGKRAGCTVYALTTTFPEPELLRAGADNVFEEYHKLMEHMERSVKI